MEFGDLLGCFLWALGITAAFVLIVLVLGGLTTRNLYRELQYQLARRKVHMESDPTLSERRMKHPALFWAMLAIFAATLVIPDFVPFLDEILFGLLAAYFGLQRMSVPVERQLPAEAAPVDLGEVESREVD